MKKSRIFITGGLVWVMLVSVCCFGEGPTITGVGFLDRSNNSMSYGVSNDGTTVIGQSSNDGFVWNCIDGMTCLDSSSFEQVLPLGVSDDGTIVVGQYMTSGRNIFIWNKQSGMRSIEKWSGGPASAYAVSGNGKYAVGFCMNKNTRLEAFIWNENDGMKGLGSLATDNNFRSCAYDVSWDGSKVVGYSNCSFNGMSWEAFIWD